MKVTLNLIMFLSLLLLVSCSDNDEKTELQEEYDIIKQSEPKKEVVKPLTPTVQAPKYKLGVDYELIEPPYATENTEQVVVYEFFGYSCGHCFYFEPFINKWLATKANYIKFERVPLNFQHGWEVLQQAYLTSQMLNITEQSHDKLFDAIHKEHNHFDSIDELAKWYAANFDIEESAFLSTANSFIVDSQQRRADKMGVVMGITGTPALVINGKYKVSKKIRDRDEIIKVMKFLAKKEAQELKLIATP
ncbi:MAG: thiol:disulfide interchange protein DsbA/DsbL [Proteobacteria bacterium]|nr:thiol:disulfide interchange protein DsbA/DsbL [Pseudomonadota bacterium]